MGKKVRLKKDIVIPAGTILEAVGGSSVKYGEGNYECTVGLTKDSAGYFVYGLDPAGPELWDWFEECE